ncbi:unnamed protein product [Durusdinium trenchii]|uniref:Uncharacterized protein n=1 Tax=Durusdinium trenchii TaxID=1381693 RepID=A0ABP0P645_9DINO
MGRRKEETEEEEESEYVYEYEEETVSDSAESDRAKKEPPRPRRDSARLVPATETVGPRDVTAAEEAAGEAAAGVPGPVREMKIECRRPPIPQRTCGDDCSIWALGKV